MHLLKTSDMNEKKKITTIPKGYRLKPDTHRFIKAVQKELELSQEKVISAAMMLYYNKVKDTKQEKI